MKIFFYEYEMFEYFVKENELKKFPVKYLRVIKLTKSCENKAAR